MIHATSQITHSRQPGVTGPTITMPGTKMPKNGLAEARQGPVKPGRLRVSIADAKTQPMVTIT
jgi:hypothetical protein